MCLCVCPYVCVCVCINVCVCVCTWVKNGLFIYSLGDCFRLTAIVLTLVRSFIGFRI